MKEMLGTKNMKKGITIVTLVITVIVLIILTGTVMLTMNNGNLFGETQSTINLHNKEAVIESIQLKVEKERLSNVNEGKLQLTIKEDILPIVSKYGAYEKDKLKLTTSNDIEVYLYEITEIELGEYAKTTYIDDVLEVTEIEEKLSSNGYTYEYTKDNGSTWETYAGAVTIKEQEGIKVRLLNSEGKVISNEYRVTKVLGDGIANNIKAITVTKAPTKVAYIKGQTFDPSGMVITVTYADNTVKTITDYTYSPSGKLDVTDKYVTISYTENGITRTITQDIVVTNRLTAIAITNLKKANYRQGQIIAKGDIEVTAVYEDGTSKKVTDFTYSPMGELQSTDTTLTVTYTDDGVTKTATKSIAVTYASSLEVTLEPEKTAYIKGENFDPEGMIVSVIYADGTALPVTEYRIIGGENLQVGTSEVIIEYTEGGITKQVSQPITVTNNVTSIAVTTAPTKKTYNHNETFDKTGMVITATYEDKTTRQLGASEYTVSTPTYGQTSVTVSYTENGITKQATVTGITVKRVLASIAVTTAPTTKTYNHGATFSTSGMVVKATYTDSQTAVAITGYSVTNGTLKYGQTSVTISYTENGVTKTTTTPVTVKRVLSSIAITTGPSKVKYIKGETFDTAGMVVKATYTDSATAVAVTGYTVPDGTNLQVGVTQVTIRYTENGITKEAKQAITVTNDVIALEITSTPDKQVYKQGENFNATGMIVTAIYEDRYGQIIDNSKLQIEGGDNLQVGTTSVKVKYTEKGKTAETAVEVGVTNNVTGITATISKKEYIKGENIEKSSLTVKATYEDGTSKTITDYTIVNGSNLQVGATSVTIRYTETGLEAQVSAEGKVTVTDKEVTKETQVTGLTVTNNVVNVAYKSGPTNKTYNHGDEFNTAGLVLTATYQDGSTKDVTTGITGPSESLSYGQTSVTVSYTENGITKQTSLSGLTVKRVLSSIAVTTAPTTTSYNHGATFNKAGMVVKATYTDSNTAVEITGYSVTNSTLTYGQTSVTISYTENGVTKTTTTPVTVKRVLSSIAVTTAPTTTSYNHGATFNTAGMVVKATYTDSNTAVAITGYTVTNGTLAYGQTSVTISYTENGVTKTTTTPVTVKRVLSSIAVTTAPTTTSYNHGATFNTAGMVVKATYTDSNTAVAITGYSVTNGTLAYGQTSVTIRYTENGVTKETTTPVTVKRVLSSIAVTTAPTTTSYNHGATFNTAGMVVKATYTDSTTAVAITGYSVTNGTLAYGQTSVTISYTENGVTKETTTPVTVKRVLSSIAVTTAPTTTSYNHGATFNTAGMVVKATYTDSNDSSSNNRIYSN